MANLKNLKLRIRSIQSTQKITKAMKTVSASKLKKARKAVETNRPYFKKINEITKIIARHSYDARYVPLFYGYKDIKNVVFVVITSDRGLCGALNSSVVRIMKQKLAESKAQDYTVTILCIGKKGYEQLKTLHGIKIRLIDDFVHNKPIAVESLQILARNLITDYMSGILDVCYVFFNKFISSLSYNSTFRQVIPLFTKQEVLTSNVNNHFMCEPKAEEIVDNLVERNLTLHLISMILENVASEHGARMSAMDNASCNAYELIKDLSLIYNKTRQTAITTELMDIKNAL